MPAPTERASVALPLALAAVGAVLLGGLNIANFRAFAPHWGQDLAFFTQIARSASQGGPWASPLLHEPQGFFAMVHSHLVLPLVVGVYALIPRQEVLLAFQGAFVGLALWPAFRLAETVARERGVGRPALLAALAALSLLLLGPLQGVGSADFRPSALFLPGLVGVFAAARQGSIVQALLWSLVAQSGRQEASYLLIPAGLALCVIPWGGARRWRVGLAVVAFAGLCFGLWILAKPQMFFHFDPRRVITEEAGPLDPDLVQARLRFLGRWLRSGGVLGVLQPTALLAGLPLAAQLARDTREWTAEVGPSVHWHVSWLCFAVPGMLAGAMAWPRKAGGAVVGVILLAVLNLSSFLQHRLREGQPELRALVELVGPEERVGADHDTIAALAGRPVLWNLDSLHLGEEQRPYGWEGEWPLTVELVDVLVMDEDHRLRQQAVGWVERGRVARGDGRVKVVLGRE